MLWVLKQRLVHQAKMFHRNRNKSSNDVEIEELERRSVEDHGLILQQVRSIK